MTSTYEMLESITWYAPKLSAASIREVHADRPFKLEGDSHPRVEIEREPNRAAKRFVARYQGALQTVTRRVTARITQEIRAALNDAEAENVLKGIRLGIEEVKEKIEPLDDDASADDVAAQTNLRESLKKLESIETLEDARGLLISRLTHGDLEVLQAHADLQSARAAVGIRSFGGDWRLYCSILPQNPHWPADLAARFATIDLLRVEDIADIDRIAAGTLNLTDDEAENSDGAPSSERAGTAPATSDGSSTTTTSAPASSTGSEIIRTTPEG